jgi:hypothetical protein
MVLLFGLHSNIAKILGKHNASEKMIQDFIKNFEYDPTFHADEFRKVINRSRKTSINKLREVV